MEPQDVTHVADLEALVAGAGMHTAFAVVRHLRRAQTRQGKPYCELRLADRSRTVAGKIWSDATRAMAAVDELSVGDHVKALFEVEEYKGALQLTIRGLRPAQPGEPGPHDMDRHRLRTRNAAARSTASRPIRGARAAIRAQIPAARSDRAAGRRPPP